MQKTAMKKSEPTIEQPELLRTERRDAAVIHMRIPRAQMMTEFGPAVDELVRVLGEQGKQPAGPVFAHHLRMEPGMFDFEVGFPVDSPIEPSGRVRPGELPARNVARTVYAGPYEGLPSAWAEFDAWMKGGGHRQAGDLWEVYSIGPETSSDPKRWRTQLNRPLAGGD